MTVSDADFHAIQQRLADEPPPSVPYRRIAGVPQPPAALYVPTLSTANTVAYGDLLDSSLLIPWDGSTPRFRALCLAKHNTGSDLLMTLGIALAAQDAAAVEGSYGTEFADKAITATTSFAVVDTGWVTPAVMPAAADTLAVMLRGKSANNTNAKTWKSLSLYIDWSS